MTLKNEFEMIPMSGWPKNNNPDLVKVFLSKKYFVQEYHEGDIVRLTICQTKRKNGKWLDGITWEQLQQIKSEIGYSNKCAVEVFPEDENVVNIANMRHLFVLPERPSFAWAK